MDKKDFRLKGLIPGVQRDTEQATTKWKFGNIVRGEKRIDNLLGFGCFTLGFGYDEIVDYVCENLKIRKPETAEEFSSLRDNNFLNDVTYSLTDFIYESTGGYRSFYAASGSDANEGALKLVSAYHYHKKNSNKKKIVSFKDSYHGSTFFTQGLSECAWQNSFYTFDRNENIKTLSRNFDIESVDWKDVACIIVESRTWVNHLKPYPCDFWDRLEYIRDTFDVLIVIDDIFVGGGKSGDFFGINSLYKSDGTIFQCDLFTMGKGITSGYFQLSITCYSDRVHNTFPIDFDWQHGFTYSFPLPGILSVIKTIDVLKNESLLEKDTTHMSDRFFQNNQRAIDLFRNKNYNINNQFGSMISIEKNNEKILFIIPFNADDEYYEVLEYELEIGIQKTLLGY